MRETLLCGDIGGTNTRFTLYEVNTSAEFTGLDLQRVPTLPGEVIFKKKYNNEDYATFADVLNAFLYSDARVDRPPASACFAVAGPVKSNKVRFTNRESWSIDGDIIRDDFNIRKVSLINDFLAMGYGILTLDEDKECVVLQKGEKRHDAPIACIGAGTGLGECFLTPDSNGAYQCFPSEGGHAEFAPRDELETDLLRYLKDKFKQQHRVSVERVASGTGLANIYEFLSAHKDYTNKVDQELHRKIMASQDKGREIATSTHDEVCRKTMEIFVRAYGAEAGVAALKWLPYGGLYLTGGLTPKNIELIRDPNGVFMSAYGDKGRVSGMLHSVPVYAVMVEDLGERGAKYVALTLLQSDLRDRTPALARNDPWSSWTLGVTAGVAGASIALLVMASLRKLKY